MRPFSCLLAAVMAALATSASATVRITSDNGGLIGDYVTRYVQVRQSGEQVVIDGVCLSACTMVVGIVPANRVCATRNAVLGFHAAWKPDGNGGKITSAPATQALLSVYPPSIRRWIARRGGLTPKMMFLQGRELASVVPPCGGPSVTARVRGQPANRQALSSALRRANIDARQGR